jgi:ribosomal protein S18 acetylase RimI-like enzyme
MISKTKYSIRPAEIEDCPEIAELQVESYQSELVALHVRQSYQRQGIGRRLATEVADRFMQTGCSSMMLWVLEHNPARQFYKRLGGRVVGQQTIDLDDNGTRAVEIAYGWEDISMLVKPDPHA